MAAAAVAGVLGLQGSGTSARTVVGSLAPLDAPPALRGVLIGCDLSRDALLRAYPRARGSPATLRTVLPVIAHRLLGLVHQLVNQAPTDAAAEEPLYECVFS